MLTPNSDQWARLGDAYGTAEYMPEWLAQAELDPSGEGAEELWGRLYHQGDAYTASYAVLPHLVRLQAAAAEPSWSAIALIAAIEIARSNGRGPAIPGELAEAYHAALRAIPEALGKRLEPHASELLTRSVLAAVAAAAGQPVTAEALLDLTPDLAQRFLDRMAFRIRVCACSSARWGRHVLEHAGRSRPPSSAPLRTRWSARTRAALVAAATAGRCGQSCRSPG